MSKTHKIISVDDYNKIMGVETLHPLVTVVEYSDRDYKWDFHDGYSYDCYTVFIKETLCGDIKYGRNYYDYQEGTIVFMAPGQVMKIENRRPVKTRGWALLFHPDLLRGTALGKAMKDFTFFSYEVSEALHLSEQEKGIVMECFRNIATELTHSIDKHSQRLIVSNIELFLGYCTRFYDRQFITRSHINSDLLSRFESLLDDYFKSDLPHKQGLPSVKYCADKLRSEERRVGKECRL